MQSRTRSYLWFGAAVCTVGVAISSASWLPSRVEPVALVGWGAVTALYVVNGIRLLRQSK